jgi:sulfonate transport system substrate-binding protein
MAYLPDVSECPRVRGSFDGQAFAADVYYVTRILDLTKGGTDRPIAHVPSHVTSLFQIRTTFRSSSAKENSMIGLRRRLVCGMVFGALVSLISVGVAHTGENEPTLPRGSSADLSRHPIYSTYRLEQDGKTVHIGIQPLWICEGNVAEVMKRDVILQRGLRELGLDIRFHAFLKGQDVDFFVRRGDLQGGMCGDMPTLAIASDTEVTVFALVDRGFNSIVANRFILLKDLKGMRIAYPYGSFSHHVLLDALSSEGLNERQVTLVPMDVAEIPEAFRRGDIEAFAAWEPAVSLALKMNPKGSVIHRSRYLGFIFFRKDFADNHPEAVRQVLASEIRAIRWIHKDKQNIRQSGQWATDAGKVFGMGKFDISSEEYSRIAMESCESNLVPIIPEADLQDNAHLAREFEFLKELGHIAKTSSWSEVKDKFDRSVVRELLKQPKKYHLDEFEYAIGGQR